MKVSFSCSTIDINGGSIGAPLMLLLIALGLTGCCCVLQGDLHSGRYIDSTAEFSIKVPYYEHGERAYRSIKARDSSIGTMKIVDFAMLGDWFPKGVYFLEWHRLEWGVHAKEYIAQIEENFHTYAREHYHSPDKIPSDFLVVVSSDERINNLPARRWIARGIFEGRQAVIAITAIDLGDRAGLVGLLFPIEGWTKNREERWKNPKEAIPWDLYLPFVESLQRLK